MAIIGIIFWGLVWGFATKAVRVNRGYTDTWFWWGFFFGLIPFIIALTKPNLLLNQTPNNYVPSQTPQAEPVAPRSAPVQTVRSPILISMGEQYNGTQFAVGSRAVVIGRSPSCTIVFASDTPGISSRHCSVEWNDLSGQFILKDLDSSYGTFLSSGERLIPNTAYTLKIGDIFYLAEKKNSFMVSEMK